MEYQHVVDYAENISKAAPSGSAFWNALFSPPDGYVLNNVPFSTEEERKKFVESEAYKRLEELREQLGC